MSLCNLSDLTIQVGFVDGVYCREAAYLNLVTLGTPLRADHTPNMNNINNWLNVYSESDMVQHIGGNEAQAGLQPAARIHPNATNIEVHWNNGPIQTHSDLRGEVGARAVQRAMQRIRP